jgi:RNA-splicing ligase RtcB
LAAAIVSPLTAQTTGVSSFAEVVGHDFGERITVHHQMESYLRYLEESSPRVTVVEQGESWEGRQLLLAIVTSPENHARLDEIR